ncbi:DNA-binding MarR family transcriptional regulator [Litorivivens lipolytica]|uniref:DNA-binding MarR family transcriptional regulator n=1 Tax=Litorivivens lipolytica TaxID=1524264 RepID=A0A7W4W7B6_9GAMM|nr:MarR family transcriptional regulator [Litorivivens lipolytica]MBB3048787.1 DNA-binding MarR family transcriptional regulator [Litorivivens lipolytica]
MDHIQDVLVALRRVIRATDLQSKHLVKTASLTAPQLMVMQTLRDRGAIPVGALADEVSLSQATVTSIIDRLEKKQYVGRERSKQDKRKVLAFITDEGLDKLKTAPTLLQESFVRQFSYLQEWEQTMIISALQRVAQMMDAQHIDASPFLDVGALDRQTEQRTPLPYDDK